MTKTICMYCDHWARLKQTEVGYCLEPTSPGFYLRPHIRAALHTLQVDSCAEYLEVPKMSGPDRPRNGVVDA